MVSAQLARLLGLFLLVLVWGCEQTPQTKVTEANQQPAKQGYTLVKQPDRELDTPDQIHLTEFFWYGCPHCNEFRHYFEPWLEEQGDKIRHHAIPVGLKPEWIDHARAFYAAQALDVLPRFHHAFYDAIHVQKKALDSAQEIVQFAASLGIDAEKFAHAMDAQATEQAILADGERIRRYGVNTTPTLVLNGKYLVSPPTAGGYDAMLDVVEDLIGQR